jgi:hypothetical protein
MTTTPELTALRTAQGRVTRAAGKLDTARAQRDELIVTAAKSDIPYRLIAQATGMSLANIGKIAAAGGVTKYPRKEGKGAITP